MLDSFWEGVLRAHMAEQVSNARQQERRIHSAVLPVLQIVELKTSVLSIQPPARRASCLSAL